MKHSRGFATFIFLAIGLVVLIGASGVTYKYIVKKEAKERARTDIVTQATEQIVKDETSDWETYRNEKYGFEFKYPSNWEINSSPIETEESILENFNRGYSYLQLFTYDTSGRRQKVEMVFAPLTDKNDSFLENPKAEVKTFNGIQWYTGRTQVLSPMEPFDAFEAAASVKMGNPNMIKKDFIVSMTGYTASGPENSIYSQTLAEKTIGILSTFKFIQ